MVRLGWLPEGLHRLFSISTPLDHTSEDFIAAAQRFRAALKEIDSPTVRKGLTSPWIFSALLSPVRVSLIAQKGGRGLRQFWESPSLLSTFALMALQDHVRPGAIIQCPCGIFWLS
jgi:hypothetical protein